MNMTKFRQQAADAAAEIATERGLTGAAYDKFIWDYVAEEEAGYGDYLYDQMRDEEMMG